MAQSPVRSGSGLIAAAIVGGMAVASLSAVYIAHGVFSRVDTVVEIVRSAPAVIESVEASAERIKVSLDDAGRRLVAARSALPAVGTELGGAGAKAVEALDERLSETQPKGRIGAAARGFVDNLKGRVQE